MLTELTPSLSLSLSNFDIFFHFLYCHHLLPFPFWSVWIIVKLCSLLLIDFVHAFYYDNQFGFCFVRLSSVRGWWLKSTIIRMLITSCVLFCLFSPPNWLWSMFTQGPIADQHYQASNNGFIPVAWGSSNDWYIHPEGDSFHLQFQEHEGGPSYLPLPLLCISISCKPWSGGIRPHWETVHHWQVRLNIFVFVFRLYWHNIHYANTITDIAMTKGAWSLKKQEWKGIRCRYVLGGPPL